MPLYEYQCDSCGARFERIQKFSDPKITVCPTCGGPVQKLFSSPAIQFKGSGFYITDYAKKGDSGGSSASSKSKSDAADAKSDASKSADSSKESSKSPADSSASSPPAAPSTPAAKKD